MRLFQWLAPGAVRLGLLLSCTASEFHLPHFFNTFKAGAASLTERNTSNPRDGHPALARKLSKAVMLKKFMRHVIGMLFLGFMLSFAAHASFPVTPAHQGVSTWARRE